MAIVCTGSIAFDYLMTFPGYFKDHIILEHLDSISLSFLVDSMVRHRGGSAPNIAYTLAMLGENPLVMGTVGDDFTEYRSWLEGKGIDTTLIKTIPGDYTASFFANTDLSNAQIASFYPGAMNHASELSLHDLKVDRPEMVIISPNDPSAMELYVEECVELGIPYLYDPSQQIVRIDPEKLTRGIERAQSLFVNQYEFELILKHTGMGAEEIKRELELTVITCGENGAYVYAAGNEHYIPRVKPQQLVDPTGVGDAFRGGFVRGFRLNLDWQTCGQMGALAATYCLEHKGTLNHAYTVNQFIARYRENFNDQGALALLLD